MPDATLVGSAESFRLELKTLEQHARELVSSIKDSQETLHDKGECIAQAMLALRHIEDARMRYGKVIQYATTGESSFAR